MSTDSPTTDAEPTDGRDESQDEKSDRNWSDILQELRVSQTGTQIISGFLLTLVFQQRFSELDPAQVALYIALVVLAAATTAVGLAPVALHRLLFARHQKGRMVAVGDKILVCALTLVSALTGGVVLLVVSAASNWTVAWVCAVSIALLLIVVLVLMPLRARSRGTAGARSR